MDKCSRSSVTTVSEYIYEIQKIIKDLSKSSADDMFWFRGESNISYNNPLTPGSYRDLANQLNMVDLNNRFESSTVREIESQVDAEFSRRGHQYLKEISVHDSFLNRYFIMQHYGIPTRLLDWSDNALVALFFAVNSGLDKKDDGIVYILNPYELNNITVQTILGKEGCFRKIPTVVSHLKKQKLLNKNNELRISELFRRYFKMDFCTDISYFPLAIMPPPLEKRMLVQSGCFTIFGNEITGLAMNEKNNYFLQKIPIDSKSKFAILKELDQLGINENSVFSDLDGLGKYLKRKYSNRYKGNMDILWEGI